jgi:uncharacterized MAPEG superfamily protein
LLTSILAPAAVLVLWTMLVMIWMLVTRLPELNKLGDRMKKAPPGGRYQDIESLIPAKVNWKSHNYTHLMEQPTVFYPAVIILHLAGSGTGTSLWLAWAYVALRIIHSLWQGLVNGIKVRMALFGLSSICVSILAVQAVLATL